MERVAGTGEECVDGVLACQDGLIEVSVAGISFEKGSVGAGFCLGGQSTRCLADQVL